jgi:hypothetical protein
MGRVRGPVKYNPESDLRALMLRQLEHSPYKKDLVTISLASYAARMNIKLLKAANFNGKLH